MFSACMGSVRRSGFIRRAAVLLLAVLSTAGLAAQTTDAHSLYGPDGVSPQAVRQGTLGSCYFHSSIAALAKAAPETLRGAIGRNALGGYRVHFASGPDEVVFPDDIAYGRTHSFDRSDGDWVLVLMRGYAQRAVRQSLSTAIQRSDGIPAYAKPVALEWLDHSGLLLVAYDRAIRSVVSQDGMLDPTTFKQALTSQLSARGIPAAEAAMLAGFLDDKGFFLRPWPGGNSSAGHRGVHGLGPCVPGVRPRLCNEISAAAAPGQHGDGGWKLGRRAGRAGRHELVGGRPCLLGAGLRRSRADRQHAQSLGRPSRPGRLFHDSAGDIS